MDKKFEPDKSWLDDGPEKSIADFLKRANAAHESGNNILSLYLYLAAFEESAAQNDAPNSAAIQGLKQAWSIACENNERQLAEYIFEKLEPFLTHAESNICKETLQDLTLDKLEEFGVSRDDLEEMAQMISEELLNLPDALQIDNVTIQGIPKLFKSAGGTQSALLKNTKMVKGLLGTGAGSDDAHKANKKTDSSDVSQGGSKSPKEVAENLMNPEEVLDYKSLAGYDVAIAKMHELGIGLCGNEEFDSFVSMLNRMHGLETMPAPDAILFRAAAREDANRFMMATLGEIQKPTIHMRMDEGFQGMPVLCVSTHGIDLSRFSSIRDVFQNGGVLVLEDLDMWYAPDMEMNDESGFFMLQLTRGAREAVDLIQNAVEHPGVSVFATASTDSEIDDFFIGILDPLTEVNIELPTPEERAEIWLQISKEHPSIADINKVDLVRLTANMPRFDIYMATREAIEDAYKTGLKQRKYMPVTRENLFDKLAAYQPLDSGEYNELQESVIDDFKRHLEDIDDLLKNG